MLPGKEVTSPCFVFGGGDCFSAMVFARRLKKHVHVSLAWDWRHTAALVFGLESVSSVCGRTTYFALGQSRQNRPGAGKISMRRAGPRTPRAEIALGAEPSQGGHKPVCLRFRPNGPLFDSGTACAAEKWACACVWGTLFVRTWGRA